MVCLDNVPLINMLTAGFCTIVLLLWKTNSFLKCCIFGESHQILMTRFLIFGSSLHCAESAWQNVIQHFQFSHSNSFCLVRYYAGFTLIIFSSYGRKSRRTRFLFDKNNRFQFSSVQLHAFECILRIQTFYSFSLNWTGNSIL